MMDIRGGSYEGVRAIYADDQGKQERHRDQRGASQTPQRFSLELSAAAGHFAPSHKASPTPGQFLDHVTGGGLEMMVGGAENRKGNPRTRKIKHTQTKRGEERRAIWGQKPRLELEKRSSGCMSAIALCSRVGIEDSEYK